MVVNSSYEYLPVAHFASSRPLRYDQNNVYTSDCQTVYAIGCYSLAHRRRFLPAPFQHNVEEYLYVQAPIDSCCYRCQHIHCCQPSILALSTRNSLGRLIGK